MNSLIVLCTVPDHSMAEELASVLLTEGLAACINILPACLSIYRWQGKIERATETMMMVKTTQRVYPRLEARIVQLHPYEIPEIISCNISQGLPAYLTWVADAVFQDGVTRP